MDLTFNVLDIVIRLRDEGRTEVSFVGIYPSCVKYGGMMFEVQEGKTVKLFPLDNVYDIEIKQRESIPLVVPGLVGVHRDA